MAAPLTEPRHLVIVDLVRRRFGAVDLVLLLALAAVVRALVGMASEWTGPLRPTMEIDLSWKALPLYTLYSLSRGLLAFAISFGFTLVYGYAAAKSRALERVLVPTLDILQSIPVLGFMPGLVLALVALFPRSNVGLELAAVLMIFTGQVWNMTFSFYHSLRNIPSELGEAAAIYRFSWWHRVTRVELPFSAVGLVWNGMMSMAGGWFFLTINEAFRLGDRDFRLPGIGSYMSVAIDRGDRGAMLAAVVAMIFMIVFVNELFWRPVMAWSQRFKLEEVAGEEPTSWLLDWLRRSGLLAALRDILHRLAPKPPARPARPPRTLPPALGGSVRMGAWGIAIAFAVYGGAHLVVLLGQVRLADWGRLLQGAGLTFLRTTCSVALGSLWAVPAGVAIGRSRRLSELLQPIIQVAAAFPAPMLFPLVLAALDRLGVSLGFGAVVLMLLGTQWYILFNVVAGAQAIPHELEEAAETYRFTRAQRWRRLFLPGIFPYLVTGWVTAAGGAWNASIVAEYVHFSGQTITAPGLGAVISEAAEAGAYPLLAAGVLTMALLVVGINRLGWKRLYDLAETRYALGR